MLSHNETLIVELGKYLGEVKDNWFNEIEVCKWYKYLVVKWLPQ